MQSAGVKSLDHARIDYTSADSVRTVPRLQMNAWRAPGETLTSVPARISPLRDEVRKTTHLQIKGSQRHGGPGQVLAPSHFFDPQRLLSRAIHAQRLQLTLQAMRHFPDGRTVAHRDMTGDGRLLTRIIGQQQVDQLVDQFDLSREPVTQTVVVKDT
jgi:hypothetical protein